MRLRESWLLWKRARVDESPTPEADIKDEILESTLIKYLEVNAAELEVEKDKPFQAIGLAHEPGGGAEGDGVEADSSCRCGQRNRRRNSKRRREIGGGGCVGRPCAEAFAAGS
jgi:hypothetical protein